MYTSQAVHAFIHWLFTLCDVERQWFYTALWLRESGSLAPGERVSGSGRVSLDPREVRISSSPSHILLTQSSCT